ncbi:MAG: hypothetical protein EP335_01250 [Alphaproteobacteria bacterium]|nr:MAG: hypothetical protein EP335_01250 [Alphaproteobacteria bacterium]
MTNLSDQAKNRAKRLRTFLAGLGHSLTHAQSLEAVAQEDGHRDWNTMSAQLKARADGEKPCPWAVGAAVCGHYRGARFRGHIRGLEIAGRGNVWKAVLQFDEAVEIGPSERLNLTRQRVRLIIDAQGQSVNLAGKPDGWLQMAPL